MELSNTIVVFDLETTGTWVEKDKIVEIALIKHTPEGQQEVYVKRVNPGIPIPAVVTQIIGITNDDLKDAPFFKEIAGDVLRFIGNADLVGFGIERFDLPVLERELKDAGYLFDWQRLNVYDLQKVYHINERRDLSAAYQFYCQKNLINAHSALADTKATLEILWAQIAKYGKGEESLEFLSQFQYETNAEYYDSEQKFRWWNGKLYMMFGKYAKNYSLQEVAAKDKNYLKWILSADFSDEIKRVVDRALKGDFPVKT